MSPLLKIRSERDSMSAIERRVADYIVENAHLLRDYSSQQLANALGISQSSVVKFSQKLGFKGYPDLKYSISEALGFEKGVSRSFREAPIFLGTFTFLVAVGAAIAVIPNLPLIRVLLVTQVINGLLLPIVLFAVLRLVNDRELMGRHVNGPWHNVLAWATTIVVTILSLAFILISVIKE
jgi:Mn2+/Fe2+ NRAMP family transporter